MKMKVASVLKEARKKLGISPDIVVQRLSEYGIIISPVTLYGYEIGKSHVNADTFLYLCKIYGITDFKVFFDEEPTGLSQSDKNLLEAYHAHPEMQAGINKMLDVDTSGSIKEALQETLIEQVNNSVKNSTSNV